MTNYALAEATLLRARENIGIDFLKTQYTKTLSNIRNNFLTLLTETGQTEAATELEKRIKAEK